MKIKFSFSSFFSLVHEAPWYREYLEPVIEEIAPNNKILDIGTGPGKLLQLLVNEKNSECIGIDVSESMLTEAKKKLKGFPVNLVRVSPGKLLPTNYTYFDQICICNVLFNLSSKDQLLMLNKSLEYLKDKGKIVILTPTGSGNIKEILPIIFKKYNQSFILWYLLTKRRARMWNSQNRIQDFCNRKNLIYEKSIVFHGFGLLEVVKKESTFFL